jgi:hypothetical protein
VSEFDGTHYVQTNSGGTLAIGCGYLEVDPEADERARETVGARYAPPDAPVTPAGNEPAAAYGPMHQQRASTDTALPSGCGVRGRAICGYAAKRS